MYINTLGHITKMTVMPIYGKNPSKVFFSATNRMVATKLGIYSRFQVSVYKTIGALVKRQTGK